MLNIIGLSCEKSYNKNAQDGETGQICFFRWVLYSHSVKCSCVFLYVYNALQ